MNGWEAAAELRKTFSADGPLRLVAISGRGDEGVRAKSRRAGFDAHVQKPVAIDLVQAIIRQMMRDR